MAKRSIEKRALQAIILVLALIPVATGGAGALLGPAFLGAQAPWTVDLDSHVRFLSGNFLIIGIAWWSCVPSIESKTGRLRLLAAMTFAGGLARLFSLALVGLPSIGHRLGLGMELIVVPLLVWWQARIARSQSDNARAL